MTVLIEVEGILNSRLLGYTSSNIADFDPVTPNYLLKGRPNSSLPPVLYPTTEVMGAYRDGGKARCLQISSGQALLDTTCQHSKFVTNGTDKWHTDVSYISPGTIAMLVDPQLPRTMWLVA